MNPTTHHTTRDVLAADDDWLAGWAELTGAARYQRYEQRLLSGRDSSIPADAWRTHQVHDVGAPPTQQGGAAAVLDLSHPYATMNARQRAGGFLPGDPGCEAGAKTAKAADGAGAGEAIDLRHPTIAAQRLRQGGSR